MGGERQVRAAIRGYLYIGGDVPSKYHRPVPLAISYRGMGFDSESVYLHSPVTRQRFSLGGNR